MRALHSSPRFRGADFVTAADPESCLILSSGPPRLKGAGFARLASDRFPRASKEGVFRRPPRGEGQEGGRIRHISLVNLLFPAIETRGREGSCSSMDTFC